MDGGQSLSRTYAEDAKRILAAAAYRAARNSDGNLEAVTVPACVSGRHLLDALQDSHATHVEPVPAGTRLTPLVQQILNEASRVAEARDATEVSAADIDAAVTNVMKATGLDPHKITEARLHAHLP
jgi:urease accessory protein UreF